MSDLFKSTYNPDALSCITTRRRLEGKGRAQSAPESGGGFPGGVCPVGPSPKVPGRLAGGFRAWRGLRRHRSPPGADGGRRRPEGRGRAQSVPESGGGFPGGVYPVGPSPKVPGRLAGGFRVRRGLRRHRPPPGAASHSSASPAVQREFRRHRTPPGRHHLSSAAVADYKKGGVCTPPSSRDPKTKTAQSRTIK